MRKILDRLSPRGLLLATLIASVLPFMLVELFPAQFYLVMDVPSYLVFHNITEFFSVMVSLSIFGVGWYAYDQSSDRHALFVSAAFLAIGLMDFMHTLSFFGMPAFFTPSSVDKGARFWILVRMFSALAFLGSAFVYAQSSRWWLSKTPLLVLALTVTGFAFAIVIFFPQYMPATFVPGVGLTSFKKDAEYLIIGLLLLATLAYWRRMSMTGDRQLVYYSAAFIVSIFSELVFVYYKSAFDTFNGLGHIYKIVAFYLIYKGIFTTSIKYPYVRLSEANAQLRIEIAERKQAEEALHESARYLRQLLNNLPAAVVVHGPDSAIRYGNPAAQQILCLNEAQLLGKTAFDPAWHFTREDGSVMPVEEYPANRVLAKRAPLQHYQVGIVRASGAEPMWAYVNAYPDLDEQGQLREVIVTFLDITELKQLQQQLKKYHAHLEDQVEQRTAQLAAANKELETFAYSVSHDLRVPLRAIDGFSLILLEDYHDKLDAEGQRVLNVVRDNAQKMGTLIDDILAFSRMGRKELVQSAANMEVLVREVFEELKQGAGGRDIQLDVKPLPVAQGDPALLRQVLVNLLGNAIKYTGPQPMARIEVGAESGGNETVYYVKDNGVGFDMQYLDKLFGVFQRLHSNEEFEGTGIGLAIVKRIIERHGGRVWAEGRVGAGATFWFALPIHEEVA